MNLQLKLKTEKHEKLGYYASDYGRLGFDIFHAFRGTEPTNPIEWTDTLRMSAGKGVELQMVQILKDNDVVDADYSQEDEQTYEMEREGVKVRMKIDAIVRQPIHNGDNIIYPPFGLIEGAPIEIKSINNRNSFDIKSYADNKPRENYVGQLAIYMDYLSSQMGYLFVASIDGLNTFWMECHRIEEGIYECGQTRVDITKEYKRWAKIQQCLNENKEPDPFEFGRYKLPIDEVKWDTLSMTDISKARNGDKVIGDKDAWKISYSPWKLLLLERQGVSLGYSTKEIEKIKELTKGYSSKTKKDA